MHLFVSDFTKQQQQNGSATGMMGYFFVGVNKQSDLN
jgi:hypothetical protein